MLSFNVYNALFIGTFDLISVNRFVFQLFALALIIDLKYFRTDSVEQRVTVDVGWNDIYEDEEEEKRS